MLHSLSRKSMSHAGPSPSTTLPNPLIPRLPEPCSLRGTWPWWAWPRPRHRRKMDLEVCNQAQPGPVGNLAKLGVLMFKVSLLPTLNVSTPSGCFGEAVCHPTRAPVQHRSSASACVPTFDPRLYSWKVRNESRIYIYKHILIRYVYSIDHVTCSTYVCIHTYIYLDIHLNLNMGYPPTISTGWLWWSFAALDVMFLGVWWLFYVHRRL